MIVNCTAGTKVTPLASGYYYVDCCTPYVLAPDTAKYPADDLQKCATVGVIYLQRGNKIFAVADKCLNTFVIGDKRVVHKKSATLESTTELFYTPDYKIVTSAGVYDPDAGAIVHKFNGRYMDRPAFNGRKPPRGDKSLPAHTTTQDELYTRGYVITRVGTPPSTAVYDYIHGAETVFDGATTIDYYINPVEIIITGVDKFMVVKCEPAISKTMPAPRLNARIDGPAVVVEYRPDPFTTFSASILPPPGHPLARNQELLYEIITDAISREPHLRLSLAENPPECGLKIEFLQKYAPDPLEFTLMRVEQDRVGVVETKIDYLLGMLPRY